MLKVIKRNYWWPEIKSNIKKNVQECTKCQQNKVQHMKKVGELHPLETPEQYSRKSVLTLLDHFQSQTTKTP